MRAVLLVTVLLLAGGVPADAIEKWGPFRGQLVDIETGKPIPDAAIIVVWYELVPTPVQTNQRFYDAIEGATDVNGRFEIPRRRPAFFSFLIREPQVIYFAPGYVPEREVITPPDGQRFVAQTVVHLRRPKTREGLLEKNRGGPVDVPPEKMARFLRAVNVERKMLGLQPIAE